MKMIPGAKAASTRTGRSNPKNAWLLLTFGPCLDRFSHFFQSTPQDLIDDGLYKTIALALHPMPHREVSMAQVAQACGAMPSKKKRDADKTPTASIGAALASVFRRRRAEHGGSSHSNDLFRQQRQEIEQFEREEMEELAEEEERFDLPVECTTGPARLDSRVQSQRKASVQLRSAGLGIDSADSSRDLASDSARAEEAEAAEFQAEAEEALAEARLIAALTRQKAANRSEWARKLFSAARRPSS